MKDLIFAMTIMLVLVPGMAGRALAVDDRTAIVETAINPPPTEAPAEETVAQETITEEAAATAPETVEPETQAPEESCHTHDRACIIEMLTATANNIQKTEWRDQVYRELAKTLAFDGNVSAAVGVIDKIQSNDTKAMTIRGIGMAVADAKPSKDQYDSAFALLREAAEKIKDPPSYAIALTYIAMAQAFAGDNDGAWATAATMSNDALRHKAYAETAEIQAENGDFLSAMQSIEYINSMSFQNKALHSVAKIFADRQMLGEAAQAARAITDPYMQAETLQYILDTQKPRDIPHQ